VAALVPAQTVLATAEALPETGGAVKKKHGGFGYAQPPCFFTYK